jgi:hypothetical protein
MSEPETTTTTSAAAPEASEPKAEAAAPKASKKSIAKKAAVARGKAKKAAPKKAAPKKAAPKKAAPKKAAPKKAAPKKAAPKAKTEGSGRPGRPSQFAGKKITKLVKENPRREGSEGHASFDLITSGMKFEKYVELGGSPSQLAYCVEHGFVKVD